MDETQDKGVTSDGQEPAAAQDEKAEAGASGDQRPKRPGRPGGVTVECVAPNVHLGDGRVLREGETAAVSKKLANELKASGQAKAV